MAAAALVAACSADDDALPCGFAALPRPLCERVFAALPADARARCASVCRAWRDTLLRASDAWRLWARLDLSLASGVECAFGDALLLGAAALARGRLQALTLEQAKRHCPYSQLASGDALVAVLRGSPELRDLALDSIGGAEILTVDGDLPALRAAAPQLQRLALRAVGVGDDDAAPLLLRAAPRFAGVHVTSLHVWCNSPFSRGLAAAVAAHDALRSLSLQRDYDDTMMSFGARVFESPAALSELVDAALARPLETLELFNMEELSPAYLPSLARLLSAPALAELHIGNSPQLFAASDAEMASGAEAGLAQLCAGVERAAGLRRLQLVGVGLAPAAADALRAAAAARRGVCELRLTLE